MVKILRGLQINEVSSVSAGAGRGVRVALMKRDDGAGQHPVLALGDELVRRGIEKPGEAATRRALALIRGAKMAKTATDGMLIIKLDDGGEVRLPDDGTWDQPLAAAGWSEPAAKAVDVLAVAKSIAAGEIPSTAITRQEFYETLRAEALKRYPAMTKQQAVAQFISEDDDGRHLNQAMKAADVLATGWRPQTQTTSYRALVAMARRLMSESDDLSYAAAMARLLQTNPEAMRLFRQSQLEQLNYQRQHMGQPVQEIETFQDPPYVSADNVKPDYTYRTSGNTNALSAAGRADGYARYKSAVSEVRKSMGLSELEAHRKVQRDDPELWFAAKAAA